MKSIFIIVMSMLILSACQSAADKQRIEDVSKRASLHYRLGIDAIHKSMLPKAFDELLLADQLEPNNPQTLDAIAYAWRLRGNNEQARAYYERAINTGSDTGSATYNNYGSLLVELGEYQLAEQYLNQALADPRYNNQALAFVNLGDALVGLKRMEEAIAAYRKAHLLAPAWRYPQLREAAAYVLFQRPNYAQALYETLLRQDPTHQPALAGLIDLLKNKNEITLLKQHLDAFIEQTTNELDQAWAKDELSHLSSSK